MNQYKVWPMKLMGRKVRHGGNSPWYPIGDDRKDGDGYGVIQLPANEGDYDLVEVFRDPATAGRVVDLLNIAARESAEDEQG